MKTYDTKTISDFFRVRSNPEFGDLLSNLKLQKLCYYAAGVIAAVRGNDSAPLFAADLEAWQHGPVIPELYHKFKEFGSGDIPHIEAFDPDSIDKNDTQILDDVYNYYGQYSAWKLRNMTHEERPWIDAFKRDDKIITIPELRDFFANEVSESYIQSYHAQG